MAELGLTRDKFHRYTWNDGVAEPVALAGATSMLRLQDALGGSDGLVRWAAGIAVDFYAAHAGEDAPDLLKARALDATKGPADLGTAVHEDVRRVILGEAPILGSEAVARHIAQFSRFLASERPEFIAAEEMVANLTLGYAGQFDFAAKLRGRPALVDVKTGKRKPTFVLQVATYMDAEFIGRPGDVTRYPMPRTREGWVLLLRADDYELVPATPTAADRAHVRFLAASYHKAAAWAAARREAA